MQLKALLVNDDLERSELIRQALRACAHEVVGDAPTGADLPAVVGEHDPDLLVIDCPVPGNALLAGLRELALQCPMPVVLFTGESSLDVIRRALSAGVSAYIVDGFEPARIGAIVNVALARFSETERLRRELAETRAHLVERKTVERAKGILMKQRGFDEPQAYHALRKMAMDRNLRIGEVAENVIAVAELLN
jgi:response regulator NasT